MQRQQPEPERHRRIGDREPRPPHRVRHPALRPRLVPEAEGEHRHRQAEERGHDRRGERQPVAPLLPEKVRQHVDVHVPARQQHVGAADEGRRDQAVGDEVGLPDRVVVEDVAHEDHLADDHHGRGDQRGRGKSAKQRDEADGAEEAVHAAPATRRRAPGRSAPARPPPHSENCL